MPISVRSFACRRAAGLVPAVWQAPRRGQAPPLALLKQHHVRRGRCIRANGVAQRVARTRAAPGHVAHRAAGAARRCAAGRGPSHPPRPAHRLPGPEADARHVHRPGHRPLSFADDPRSRRHGQRLSRRDTRNGEHVALKVLPPKRAGGRTPAGALPARTGPRPEGQPSPSRPDARGRRGQRNSLHRDGVHPRANALPSGYEGGAAGRAALAGSLRRWRWHWRRPTSAA